MAMLNNQMVSIIKHMMGYRFDPRLLPSDTTQVQDSDDSAEHCTLAGFGKRPKALAIWERSSAPSIATSHEPHLGNLVWTACCVVIFDKTSYPLINIQKAT